VVKFLTVEDSLQLAAGSFNVPKSVTHRHDDTKYNLSKERKRLMKNRFYEKKRVLSGFLQ
jgi:hypothetical protein